MPSRRCNPTRTGDSVSISLLDAATKADEAAVLRALLAGADINALDTSGRSVVGCALASERWNEVDASDASYSLQTRLRILKTFITHDKISLYTLNAPQVSLHGVTPLGLAAWLNVPEVVRMLLEDSHGLVSVDGMDALGATPLMYAARDGNVAVVQCLLAHGARPDFRDVNHCTSIQHALRHPQVLWLCESFLRRHRARETLTEDNKRNLSQLHPELDDLLSITPHLTCHPKLALKPSNQELHDMANRLITCIRTADIQLLHSLLFPSFSSPSSFPKPYLVNYPDSDGLSPIHHCVSVERPSTTVLDVLYRAGADVSLSSRRGQGSPLHCLARNARSSTPSSIKNFIQHLVIDLRAPLAARDDNLDTCIHVAAEFGQSSHVLDALLTCDATGVIRELRNSRGLTAAEVAKPQFRGAFGLSAESERSISSASVRTIKPSTSSVQSAASLAGLNFGGRLGIPAMRSGVQYKPVLTELERATLPLSIADNLRCLLRQATADQELGNTKLFDDLIQETESMGEDILMHMQTRVAEATEDLGGLRGKLAGMESFIRDLAIDDQGKESRLVALERAWDAPDQSRRRTTDSDESDRTAVSTRSSQDTHSLLASSVDSEGSRSVIALDADPFARLSPEGSLRSGLRPVRSMINLGQRSSSSPPPKPASPIQPEKDRARTGASRVKAWLKKKFAGETLPKLPLIKELDETEIVNAEPAVELIAARTAEWTVARARIMFSARSEMVRIRESIETTDRYLLLATRYISQAKKMLDTVLQQHKTTLERARLVQKYATPLVGADKPSDMRFIEFPPITIPSSPRDSQLVFPRPPTSISPKSSVVSISSTLIEGEAEDSRVLRSLLMHKIERRTNEAFSEIEKATTCLRIVREVTRPLRRRPNDTPR